MAMGVVVDVHAQAPSTPPVASDAALARLPDWSGWWGYAPTLQFQGNQALQSQVPLKPELLAAVRANPDADPFRYCRPQQFTGSSGGFTEALEFLFTPGRVTLTNERGLLRRIYTGGQAIPADLDPTSTGLSVGHWEGETLVVETTRINPRALIAGAPIGESARITERILLKDPNTLQFEVTTVAPAALTEPHRMTLVYARLPKTVASEITFCTEFDRSIDPNSGKQRFDMTPPPDLPPPPPRR
jgi:hypothetical protein